MKGIKERIKKYLKGRIASVYEKKIGTFFLKHKGFCVCCNKNVTFTAKQPWLRDYFFCGSCKSIPRERALMKTIEEQYPDWNKMKIHESSPGGGGHSARLRREANLYTETQFLIGKEPGEIVKGIRNEDLESQTFENEVFDLVITADVMEHVYDPEKAFKEIHRTLKPGGAHIFSVPLINRFKPTQRWAEKGIDGEPIFLFEPEWHGNPVNAKGSPVTMHWGYDIIDFIKKYTRAECEIFYYDDLDLGIRAEYREIIVAKKTIIC